MAGAPANGPVMIHCDLVCAGRVLRLGRFDPSTLDVDVLQSCPYSQ